MAFMGIFFTLPLLVLLTPILLPLMLLFGSQLEKVGDGLWFLLNLPDTIGPLLLEKAFGWLPVDALAQWLDSLAAWWPL